MNVACLSALCVSAVSSYGFITILPQQALIHFVSSDFTRESHGKPAVQESGNIACTLGHGHNFNGPGCSTIDYEVSAHRPEQNRVGGQVLAVMAYAGRVADGVKRIEQLAYPLVGGVNIILGDIVPNVIQVAVGILAQNILRHALAFRRCSDLRLSRARASAGETCWPRSSVSRRRPSSWLNPANCSERAWSCSSSSRSASLTTSLAELYRPDSTLALTNFSSSLVRETFMVMLPISSL